jgi:hypothetical protein
VTELDGKSFHEDAWTRPDGGGGISRVLQDGNVWEKAGVNVSVVYGSMPPAAYRAATERKVEASPDAGRVPFFAAGISSVMHPRNPHAPTMHFNYRCASARALHRQRCGAAGDSAACSEGCVAVGNRAGVRAARPSAMHAQRGQWPHAGTLRRQSGRASLRSGGMVVARTSRRHTCMTRT